MMQRQRTRHQHARASVANEKGKTVPDSATKALARLLIGVTEPMFVLDHEGRIAGASQCLLSLIGFREEQLVGRKLRDFLIDDIGADIRDGALRFRCSDNSALTLFLQASIVDVGRGRQFKVGVLSSMGDQAAAPVAEAVVVRKERMREAFNNSLQTRFSAGQEPHEAMAGRIELIGLDDLKASLGADWQRLRDRTKAIARSIIDRRLSPGDVFAESDDDSFVICFASMSASEARFKSERIAQEIREKLLGEETPPVNVEAQAEKVRFKTPEVHGGVDLMSSLVAQLDAARAEQARFVQEASEQLRKSARLVLSPLLASNCTASGMAVARVGSESSALLSRIMGSDSEAKAIFDLDTVLLVLAIKHLFGERGGQLSSIILPVHYQTLADRRSLNDYLTLCERMDGGTRKRILFELHSIPSDAPPSRLQDMFGCLGPFSAARIMRVKASLPRLGDIGRYRLAMISLPAPRDLAFNTTLARAFAAFVGVVHGQGCQLLVREVPDLPAAAQYFERRVDYLYLANGRRRAEEPAN